MAVVALALAMTVPGLGSALTVEVTARGDNDWGLEPDSSNEINTADCLSDVKFTYTITLEGESTSGRQFYIYKGSGCDTSPTSCTLLLENSAADKTFQLTVSDIFGSDTGCDSGTSEQSIWVGLLTEEDQTYDDEGYWVVDGLLMSSDFDGPGTAPTGVATVSGDNKVQVSWTEPDDTASLGGYRVFYWSGSGSSSSDADTDADADSDADADADTDSGVDAGAVHWPDGDLVPYADADGGVAPECPTGGPTAGGEYDPAWVTGYKDVDLGAGTAGVNITGLANGTAYLFAVVTLDDFNNPSPISEVVCAYPELTSDFFDDYSGAGGKGSGNFCFVATAAFGSYDHPVVRVLRSFRDVFLRELPGGKLAIAAYYASGPVIARPVAASETLARGVRGLLWLLAGLALLLMSVGPGWVVAGVTGSVVAGVAAGVSLRLPGRRR